MKPARLRSVWATLSREKSASRKYLMSMIGWAMRPSCHANAQPSQAAAANNARLVEQLIAALQLIERQQHHGNRQHQQQRADGVETLAHGAPLARGQGEPGRQRGECDRCAEGEYARPAKTFDQKTADDRSEPAAEADQQGIKAQHLRATVFRIKACD